MTSQALPTDRIHRTTAAVLDRVRRLAERSTEEPLTLRAVPPPGEAPYPYGDLVPQGLLLMALERARAVRPAEGLARQCERLRSHLLDHRTRGLWAYHAGGLETSIDSGLVLLGVGDRAAIQALQRFDTGSGNYLPQLATTGRELGRMTVRPPFSHWCQPDYTIACLVRFLRHRSGLDTVTPRAVLEQGFAERSGLYLANPYFVDWLLALGLTADGGATAGRLRGELLAARSPDGTFGGYDVVLSSALGILALRALGTGGVAVAESIAALSMLVEDDVSAATPFYSTQRWEWSRLPPWDLMHRMFSDDRGQLIRTQGQEHGITFYEDLSGLVVLPLVLLALLPDPPEHRGTAFPDVSTPAAETHERYRCTTPSQYVARFALPPYLRDARPARRRPDE